MMMRMESTESYIDSSFGNAKRLLALFVVYAITLSFVSLILPGSEYPPSAGTTMISRVLVLMMPIELLIVYVTYLAFRRRSVSFDIIGPAVLMFLIATAPSIYAVVIGLIDSPLRYIAASLGLIFSLVGLLLSLRLLSALKESVATANL
ncbi:MAG: hypothetical protein EAX87_10860 [Candidatus Thorarchaeota archaeon]|nr:hypothetical protein [Candidatus Thorarchaeota archaeon]